MFRIDSRIPLQSGEVITKSIPSDSFGRSNCYVTVQNRLNHKGNNVLQMAALINSGHPLPSSSSNSSGVGNRPLFRNGRLCSIQFTVSSSEHVAGNHGSG